MSPNPKCTAATRLEKKEIPAASSERRDRIAKCERISLEELVETNDTSEGILAFLEKRPSN